MPTQLEQILSQTSLTVADRRKTADLAALERKAAAHQPRGFVRGLRAAATTGTAIIAELKKASPSKGLLRADYRPGEVARGYAQAGAAAISVLTDGPFFQGSLADLEEVSGAVKIPVLRKDFMVDPFQVLEARAAGADAILLIVAAHTDANLHALKEEAQRQSLDVLCEVHDLEELKRASGLGVQAIGVNCRNLKTLQVHLNVHEQLADCMPRDVVRVAESGISTRADVERLLSVGYDAFLVGESLMRHAEPSVMLTALLGGVDRSGATLVDRR